MKYFKDLKFNKESGELYEELYKHALASKIEDILEVGTGWGVSASAFLTAKKNTHLTTVDKISVLPEFDMRMEIINVDKSRITREIGKSEDILRKLKRKHKEYDLVFIDGSHKYKDVISDARLSWDLLRVGGTMIFDDYCHDHNYDGNYGVNKAVRDFCREKDYQIMLVNLQANGLAVIRRDE